MFRDLLSSRLIQVGLVFFVIVAGGSLLYSWYARRTTEAELAQTNRPVQQPEKITTKGYMMKAILQV